MEVKGSGAQGRHREVGSKGSAEQKHEPMDKNRIEGERRGTSWPTTAKSISIKSAWRRFGGCVRKAVVLTSGGLDRVQRRIGLRES